MDRQLPAGVRLHLDPFHLGMVEPMTKMFSSLYSLAGGVSQPRRGRGPRYRGPSWRWLLFEIDDRLAWVLAHVQSFAHQREVARRRRPTAAPGRSGPAGC
jgi:hypothetical protein